MSSDNHFIIITSGFCEAISTIGVCHAARKALAAPNDTGVIRLRNAPWCSGVTRKDR
jgi:hypothetical protein